MYGEPRPDAPPPAAVAALELLAGLIHRIAEAGRLRVTETLATELVSAAGCGTAFMLIARPEDGRDMATSAAAREAAIAAITTDSPPAREAGASSAAVNLRATLGTTTSLTEGERALMAELLDRIASTE